MVKPKGNYSLVSVEEAVYREANIALEKSIATIGSEATFARLITLTTAFPGSTYPQLCGALALLTDCIVCVDSDETRKRLE